MDILANRCKGSTPGQIPARLTAERLYITTFISKQGLSIRISSINSQNSYLDSIIKQ